MTRGPLTAATPTLAGHFLTVQALGRLDGQVHNIKHAKQQSKQNNRTTSGQASP
jgi:hypothetical protein